MHLNLVDSVNRRFRLKAGDSVICPGCRRTMLKCIQTPVVGMSNWADWFQPVMFSNQVGAQPWCPNCNAMFYDPMNGVYTKEHGWTF